MTIHLLFLKKKKSCFWKSIPRKRTLNLEGRGEKKSLCVDVPIYTSKVKNSLTVSIIRK